MGLEASIAVHFTRLVREANGHFLPVFFVFAKTADHPPDSAVRNAGTTEEFNGLLRFAQIRQALSTAHCTSAA
jgi:hypothetical protein